jgi:hypothetical protein
MIFCAFIFIFKKKETLSPVQVLSYQNQNSPSGPLSDRPVSMDNTKEHIRWFEKSRLKKLLFYT